MMLPLQLEGGGGSRRGELMASRLARIRALVSDAETLSFVSQTDGNIVRLTDRPTDRTGYCNISGELGNDMPL